MPPCFCASAASANTSPGSNPTQAANTRPNRFIADSPLVHASRCALRLTVQDQRIDGAPDVVNRSIANDLNLARFGIEFDFANLRAADRECLVGNARRRPFYPFSQQEQIDRR